MKYRIGELEVEAAQWNDDIETILDFVGFRILYTTGPYLLLYFGELRIKLGTKDFLVKVSEDTFFSLPASQFEKIATKVKEPRFKVGHEVYWISKDCDGLSVDKTKVGEVVSDKDLGFCYDVGGLSLVKEKYLLTLEEAIERLKEL